MAETEFEFEKLQVYADARAFRCRIYKLVKLLPASEFKLTIQVRDAARSLTNCRQSRGSLLELVDDINLCRDEEYAKPEHLDTLRTDAAALLKRLNSYIKYLTSEGRKLLIAKRRTEAANY